MSRWVVQLAGVGAGGMCGFSSSPAWLHAWVGGRAGLLVILCALIAFHASCHAACLPAGLLSMTDHVSHPFHPSLLQMEALEPLLSGSSTPARRSSDL